MRELNRHMAGKAVSGARTTQTNEKDVRAIGEAAKISQPQLAELFSVILRTFQNGEQRRTRPTGAVHALLKIMASNPKSATEALHASLSETTRA